VIDIVWCRSTFLSAKNQFSSATSEEFNQQVRLVTTFLKPPELSAQASLPSHFSVGTLSPVRQIEGENMNKRHRQWVINVDE
jgi:hypothetical protein